MEKLELLSFKTSSAAVISIRLDTDVASADRREHFQIFFEKLKKKKKKAHAVIVLLL